MVLVLVAALALLSANPRETTGEKEVTVEGTSKTLCSLSYERIANIYSIYETGEMLVETTTTPETIFTFLVSLLE